MLPGLAPMFGGVSGGNDAFTKLLLHFDGANGSTVITDSSLSAKGNGTNAGATAISTAQFKFGTSSFLNSNNGYCTFPNHADWNFGAGDFTVDWWEYRTAAGCVLSRDLGSTFSPFFFGYNAGGGNQVYMTSNGSSFDIANGVSMGANIGSAWTHYAVTRSGNTIRIFQNGVQQGSSITSALALFTNANPLCIGAAQGANNMGGYTDELRISKGIARWTANFTPPTKAYS